MRVGLVASTRNSPSIPVLRTGPRAGTLAPLLAITGRSRYRGWPATSGGSRLGLLYGQRNISYRVVGLKRRLAIPGRSRFAGRRRRPVARAATDLSGHCPGRKSTYG